MCASYRCAVSACTGVTIAIGQSLCAEEEGTAVHVCVQEFQLGEPLCGLVGLRTW